MTVVVVTTFPGAQVEKFQQAFDRHADTVVAVDEWGSVEEFERFFGAQEDIRKVIAEVGITGRPSSVSYRILDTPDRF